MIREKIESNKSHGRPAKENRRRKISLNFYLAFYLIDLARKSIMNIEPFILPNPISFLISNISGKNQ